jgi:hypothetical protein
MTSVLVHCADCAALFVSWTARQDRCQTCEARFQVVDR